MRLLCLTRYDVAGASSRYRTYQYLPLLRAAGIEVDEAPLLDHRYIARLYGRTRQDPIQLFRASLRRAALLLRARSYDLLWLEKELFPFAPAVVERLLRIAGVPVVVDYDDALFHRYDRHRSAVVRLALGRKIDSVMRSASMVVAGNNYLADRAQRAGASRVEVLPTVIDLDKYPTRTGKRGNHPLTVGWIGSPSTQRYLHAIARPLALFCAQRGARAVAIGAHPDFKLPGVKLEVVPWTPSSEIPSLHQLDVGLMPLPDEPFERGKCGFKLVQYMGCGLPVIASPVGINNEIVSVGETGFLANSDDDWLQALQTLDTSGRLRERMGRNGRARAELRYSLQSAAPRLLNILRRAAAGS